MDDQSDSHAASRKALFSRTRGVGILTLLSRILGLIRDAVMGSQFGSGTIMDAFTTAFRIPNLARQLFGEGALSTSFLPVFLRDLEQSDRRTAFQTASAVLVVTAATLLVVVLLIEAILIGVLLFVPLSADSQLLFGLLVTLTPYLMLVCVLAQACAVMQGLGEFRVPAMFPELLNALWIGVAFALDWLIEADSTRIYLMAGAIDLIAVIQLAICVPTLRRLGFRFEWNWSGSRSRLREISRTTAPIMFGLAVTQINQVSDSLIAWLLTKPAEGIGWLNHLPLTEGSATALYYGQRLYQFPLGVFAVALGTVIFPLLATHAARGQKQHFGEDLIRGLKLCVAISVPASVGLMLIARPLTELLFEYGKFDAGAVRQTSGTIAAYGAGVWAASALLILNRAWYALGDRRTPLRIGMAAVLLNLAVNLSLVWHFGATGLAAGTALTAAAQCFVSGRCLTRRLNGIGWRDLLRTVIRTVVASVLMVLACVLVQWLLPNQLPGPLVVQRLLRVGLPVLSGMLAYLGTAKWIGLTEPFELLRRSH